MPPFSFCNNTNGLSGDYMREINVSLVEQAVAELCISANKCLPQELESRIAECAACEECGLPGSIMQTIEDNIAAAKELMAATDLKIYEVSSRVGFDSAFYFSKVFKKLEGASPREYIQRMKGSYVDAKDDAAL